MTVVTTRRAIVAGTALVAAATVAAAALLRKPAPEIHELVADATPEHVPLQGMAALRRTEPPRAMPPIAFTDADGAPHQIADYAGKGVVLNLWATWCVPCVAELPALADLARQLAADGIVVLPLSSDRGGAAAVRRFFAGHDLAGLPVLIDGDGAAGRALGTRGVPTTIIIDRGGAERARLEGAADWASPAALAAIRALVG
jgi:thiol-disulfide isomerase/thioredoxin